MGWGLGKIEMLSDLEGWRLTNVLEVQSLFFLVRKNWIGLRTRNHVELNINVLLTRNLPFELGHPLTTQFHCLWAKMSAWSF